MATIRDYEDRHGTPTEKPRPRAHARWVLRVLGAVSVEGNGETIDRFPTRRAALILIRLALAQGRGVSRDSMSAALWPDEYADTTKPRFRQELARLRKALGDAEDIVEADRLTLRLNTDKVEVDLKTAEQLLLKSSLEQDPERRLHLLEPLAEYSGELAPGYDEPWIVSIRDEWRNRSAMSLIQAAEACDARGEVERAVRLARKAASNHVLSETIQSRFLQLLVRLDRTEEATIHLNELDRTYRQLLGAGPSERLAQWVWPKRLAEPKRQAPRLSGVKIRPLPAALAKLFGREPEVESLAAVLKPFGNESGSPQHEGSDSAHASHEDAPANQARLVTLSGPGGIGKTQLSLALGRRLSASYQKRVWFIALSAVQNPARIGKVILDALGVAAIDEDPIDAAVALLDGEPALLILDNFEQLVDGGAHLVRRLLEGCDQLSLLVTSRRRLNVEGEHEHSVSPLSLASGVDLFVNVARATRPSFVLDDAGLQKVADIVKMLDRMPLAINLAAARVGVLSLHEMEQQLVKRFDLLVSRRGDLEPRHRTLRQAMAWSYDHLRPELQRFFVDLSVFRGGWTAALASEVLEEPDSLGLLEELRENSFIVEEPTSDEMRFNMLVTLRDFASERQELRRQSMLGRRLSLAMLRLAQEASKHMLGADQFWWYSRMQREHDNIRAALQYASESEPALGIRLCSELWRFWSVRGHQLEARGWFERFLKSVEQTTETVATARFGAARCSVEQGDTTSAIYWYASAREAFVELKDEDKVMMIDANLGSTYLFRGEIEKAYEVMMRSLDYWVQQGRAYAEGLARDDLSGIYMEEGKLDEAADELAKAKALLEGHTDKIALAYCFISFGRLCLMKGELDQSREWLMAALDIHERFGNQHGIGLAFEHLANHALAMGALTEVDRCLGESAKARTSIGDWLGVAEVNRLTAELERRRGNNVAARMHTEEAARLFRACGCDMKADALGDRL